MKSALKIISIFLIWLLSYFAFLLILNTWAHTLNRVVTDNMNALILGTFLVILMLKVFTMDEIDM